MSITRFVTFYSYKGGVGRTLALGNVAWEAARNGKKVLIVDFDLEAPGISSILPFRETMKKHISDKNKKGGLFEFILDFQKTQKVSSLATHYTTQPIIEDDFQEGGSIYIIPAGKEDITYKKKLQAFNWGKFYAKENGNYLLNNLRSEIISEFGNPDFVLIDSRTGLTDIGGICTILLPDKVVIFTGLNDQNINGCKRIIDSIEKHSEYRKKEQYIGPIGTILVASHVPDTDEYDLGNKRLDEAKRLFRRKIDVIFPYVAILSLEERLLIKDRRDDKQSKTIIERYHSLYDLIVTGERELEIYYDWLENNYSYLDAEKLHGKGEAVPLSLQEIFIPLYAYDLGREAGKTHFPEERKEPIDIETLIANNDYLLIEGYAGSGKTTLLKHLTYCLANQDREDLRIDGLDDYLPVLILFKDLEDLFGDSRTGNKKKLTAEDILTWYFNNRMGSVLSLETVNRFLEAKKTIFLLDGLDEILPEHRDKVVNVFADLTIKHKGNKVVLSGRPHGLEGAVVNRFGSMRTKILPLNIEQVNQFINKWFIYLYPGSSGIGGKNAQAMIGEIKDHPAIEQLIDNPLMLTAICILYHDGKELPGQRAELYKKFIDNLLYRRFNNPEIVHEFLKTLAFKMHESGARAIDRAFATEILRGVFKKRDGEDKEEYVKRIDKEFDDIEPRCGLLKFEGGQHNFWHLTFQEFLTARYIMDNSMEHGKAIKAYWTDDWYKEVIELYIGYLSMENKRWANQIVSDVIDAEDKAPYKRWLLAGGSLIDIHKDRRDPDVLDKARKRLLDIIDASPEPKIIVEAGEIMGWLGDTRDLKAFVQIGGGKYDLEDIGKNVEIRPFEIGKYPVTNSWFEEFIEADGYAKNEFWSDEGLKWLKNTKTEQPYFWNDRKWKCPNSPVVGVSWYEAYAFTRWLTLTIDDGYTYRLLTEKEWQAAAAGPEGREYPWVGEWEKERCNNREIKIEKTSPVGIFQQGSTPDGIADLSGNVWEWTLTDYDSRNDLDDFNLEQNKEEFQLPALRGGSWLAHATYCRCVSSFRSLPNNRDSIIGFRCARTI